MIPLAIRIEMKGDQQAVAAFHRLDEAFTGQAPKKGIESLTERALKTVKERTPGSGRVRDLWSIRKEISPLQHMLRYSIRNALEEDTVGRSLLEILEGGSKPHDIRPLNKRTLSFPIMEERVFAAWVKHPGTTPYAMILTAYQELLQMQGDVSEEIHVTLVRAFEHG